MFNKLTLSGNQIADFGKNGFLILPAAMDSAQARELQKWSNELSSRPEKPGAHWVYHETSLLDSQSELINRIENMTPFHDGFDELAGWLGQIVGQVLGEPAALFKDKINFKMPGGEGFKPHQDSQAGWEKYASYFVTAMVSIDAATLENGCLEIARRQEIELVGNEWEPLNGAALESIDFQPLPSEPGDVLLFDSYVPHRSEPNLSPAIRRMYFATYNRLSEGDHLERYYADKRLSFPPDIEREPDKEYVYRV